MLYTYTYVGQGARKKCQRVRTGGDEKIVVHVTEPKKEIKIKHSNSDAMCSRYVR